MSASDLIHLFKGIIFGFCISAPVGPIAVLCVRRTLKFGSLSGFLTGVGCAVADTIYGVSAGFGLVSVSQALMQHQFAFRILGGVILAVVGIKILSSEPPGYSAEIRKANLWTTFLSAFVLAVTNPMTILSFAALFAALGLASPSYLGTCMLVLGIFVGSSLWWGILSQITHRLRHRLPTQLLHWFNLGSGIAMVGFSAVALFTAFNLGPAWLNSNFR